MTCQEVMELMQRHLDGDLSDAEKRVMHRHRSECGSCAAMFERLNRLSDELVQLPKVTPAYSIVDSIMPKLAEIDRLRAGESRDALPGGRSNPSGRSWSERLRESISLRALGGVAAAAVLFGLIVTNGLSLELSGDDDASDEALYDSAATAPAAAGQQDVMFSMKAPESAAASLSEPAEAQEPEVVERDAEARLFGKAQDQYGDAVIDPNTPVSNEASDFDRGGASGSAEGYAGKESSPEEQPVADQPIAFPAETPADSGGTEEIPPEGHAEIGILGDPMLNGLAAADAPTMSEPVFSADATMEAYVETIGTSHRVIVARVEDFVTLFETEPFEGERIDVLGWFDDDTAVDFQLVSSVDAKTEKDVSVYRINLLDGTVTLTE